MNMKKAVSGIWIFIYVLRVERRDYMSIFDDVNNWQKTEGAELFSSIISVPEPVILDYGCGAGTYSFAAAYAFDQKGGVTFESLERGKMLLFSK